MPLVCSLTAEAAAAHSGSRLFTEEESKVRKKKKNEDDKLDKEVNPKQRIHDSKIVQVFQRDLFFSCPIS